MIEVELIVGTMGVEKILAGKIPKYSQALMSKAATTLKVFRDGAKTFVDSDTPGSLPDEQYGLERFEHLQGLLQQDAEFVDIADGIAGWPTEMQTELLIAMADVKAYLGQQLPQQQVSGSFSGQFIQPSDSDQYRFMWQANLVDDVRKFVELFNSGSITPVEAALMRTLFPQTHDYLVIEVMDKVLEATIDGTAETWEGTWRKQALSGLLGVQIMNFSDVMGYQSGHVEKTAGRPKGQGAIQIAKVNTSDNQAIDSRTIDKSKI